MDGISQAISATVQARAFAPAVVFVSGVFSSVGPCVAPRFIAVAGLTADKAGVERCALAGAFIGGLVCAYAAFGALAPLVGRMIALSSYMYGTLSITLAFAGAVALWRGNTSCAHQHRAALQTSVGGALLLGASFAFVVSPCCTPVVFAILAYTSGAGSSAYACALLACFALGHALPVAALASGTQLVNRYLLRDAVRQAATVVGAALMLGLSMYYAVLA